MSTLIRLKNFPAPYYLSKTLITTNIQSASAIPISSSASSLTSSRLASLLAHINSTSPAQEWSRPFSSTSNFLSKMKFPGSCYCRSVKYEIELENKDEARTSICHCGNCKKFTGGNFGITTKIPKSAWKVTSGEKEVKVHEADNGSGVLLHREFCGVCGSGLLEYGANAGDFIYIFYGTMDKPEELPPKGEFFCKYRDGWMPEVPGIFHKNEIKT